MAGDKITTIWRDDAGHSELMRRLWNTKVRDKQMLDLANLNEDGCAKFLNNRPWLKPEPDSRLLVLRDQLRGVWGHASAAAYIDGILRLWLGGEQAKDEPPAFIFFDPLATIAPNPANLRVTLAFGVIDNFQKLGVCGNPKCPRPYFLRSRAGQQFCNRKACLSYGQREHKLRWWRTQRSAGGRKAR